MASIIIAGDYCPHERIEELLLDKDFESLFGEVKPVIEKCDFSIVNFECSIESKERGTIKKAGPLLKCTPRALDALSYAGFKCVTLANNHFRDNGESGVRETIQSLTNAGIAYVGGGDNLDEAGETLYFKVKDFTVAIINCCEHEFSIATASTGGSNPLNPIQQFYAISEAKTKADYVLVIVHGGIEHFQYPSPRMVETYRFFVDAGADAIINHHQHCFSGAEIWHGKPIFYGLGNFCFDWQQYHTQMWEEGYMVQLELDGGDIGFHLIPYNQNGIVPGVHLKDENQIKEWEARFDAISDIIVDKKKLKEIYEVLLAKTERLYSSNLTPYTKRISLALYMRHLLPLLLPKRKLRTLYNMLMCESHYDRMLSMLRNYSK